VSALLIFAERPLQDMLIQREIRDELLQPGILLFDLTHPAQLADAQVRELLLPYVERRLTLPSLPTDIGHGGATLGLPQRTRNLFFRKS
jgi:hypothetical protein